MTTKDSQLFESRLERHQEELQRLYLELYANDEMFDELCRNLRSFSQQRGTLLKRRDVQRESNPDWYKNGGLMGMMLYIDNFAGSLRGVREKLDYLEKIILSVFFYLQS